MKTNITKIGNSKGVIIPSRVLQECGFQDEVEMEVRGNSVVLSPARRPREGWEEAFKSAVREEAVLPEYVSSEWDEKEWQW